MSDKDAIIKRLKSKGYWEINVRPVVYNPKRLDKQALKEIVRLSVVQLRGWDYPHFYDTEHRPYPIINGIEQTIEWEAHVEFWRFTQSANFLHLLALREDWFDDSIYEHMHLLGDSLKGKKWLGVGGTLFTVTEIFEFARRLAAQNIFGDKVAIFVKLYDLKDRILAVDSAGRLPFMSEKKARIAGPWSYDRESLLVTELTSKSAELAMDAFLNLVYLFDWENPPIDSLKNDQERFLQHKL